MIDKNEVSAYRFDKAERNLSHEYLLPALFDLVDSLNLGPEDRQIFKLGGGNGSVAGQLA